MKQLLFFEDHKLKNIIHEACEQSYQYLIEHDIGIKSDPDYAEDESYEVEQYKCDSIVRDLDFQYSKLDVSTKNLYELEQVMKREVFMKYTQLRTSKHLLEIRELIRIIKEEVKVFQDLYEAAVEEDKVAIAIVLRCYDNLLYNLLEDLKTIPGKRIYGSIANRIKYERVPRLLKSTLVSLIILSSAQLASQIATYIALNS